MFCRLNYWIASGYINGQIYNVKCALIDIFCFFYVNNPDDAYDYEMAEQFIKDPVKFNEEAKKWTKLYASS